MRIKKIELIGFKSFKDRTVIHFDAGITGIVGPNGCGKSNIVDALVWVMGEMSAKDLRGSQMTDVIFAGAEGYAPMGMAEVSLTLENDGGPFPAKYIKHSEVMVTRRLYRSAESEYFINKEPARLKDIQEIFMDTGAGSKGFSIIQQGMIGKIITSKPEDRRMLIEEAAGITKFKARKKESQRKLQQTDQNILRLQDIIGELKRQIDSLQRQAQRAERYRNLKKQIEDLELWSSSVQYAELKQAADEAERIYNEAQSMEVEGEAQLGQIGAMIEELRVQVILQEKEVNRLQEESYSSQSAIQKKEMELQELKFEIEQARRNEQMTGTILQEQEARFELLSRDLAELESQHEEISKEAFELKSEFETKNSTYQNFHSRIQEVDEELTAKRREFFAIGQTESSLDARLNSMDSQASEFADRIENETQVLAELADKKSEFEARRKKVFGDLEKERQLQMDLSNDVESFEANKKILTEQQTEKRIQVEEFKDQLNEVTSRLYGLENLQSNFEGFEEGVKNVMLWQKTKSVEITADGSAVPIFKPVAEVVEVPGEYEVAMEAALGTRLQMLLSPDAGIASEAIQYLKDQNSGRSSFISEGLAGSAQKNAASPLGKDGVQAILKDVVQSSDKYKNTVNSILDGVAVVDSIKTALKLRPEHSGWSFVTVDGDVLSQDGVLTGGAGESADSGVLKRRREIKELTDAKNEFAGKLALAQAALKKVEEQLNNIVNDFEGAQKRKNEQEIKVAELKKDFERAETEVSNVEAAFERQQRELSRLQLLQTQQNDKMDEIRILLEDARTKKIELEEANQALTEELNSRKGGFDQLQEEVTKLQVQSASKSQELQGVERQLNMVRNQVRDLETQLSRMSEESSKNSSQMTENQYLLEEKKIEIEKFIHSTQEIKAQYAQAKDDYEKVSASLKQLETDSSASLRARNERQSKMNEAQLKLEQAKMKEQYLIDQVRERYMLRLEEIYTEYKDREGDLAGSEIELKELKDKLSKIGEVNLSAIEEFEETSKRYEFLTKQQSDLNEAKEQLRKVIDRINRICSKRFKETFDLVNEKFTKVFPVLFGGGEAMLQLHEDTEKGEMGVEIIARPPGKKMQSITLMSGGEKALTAVALIFSIFLVKPSPYCLLDEVDAPLDDANVARFNDLVREMAKRSQIIVVTHNKHTMEVAKKLYGVTMQDRGVSTMVSVNLADI